MKINDRRSAGLVAYPRIGRKSDLFPRLGRTFGIIQKPRVGRSDDSSLGDLNRLHDLPADTDIEFYITRDMEPDVLLNFDYEGVKNFIKIISEYEKNVLNIHLFHIIW